MNFPNHKTPPFAFIGVKLVNEYEYRFVGCRIFCCKADADFQSCLTEDVLEKLKSLCIEFEIPYVYRDLASALNGPSTG